MLIFIVAVLLYLIFSSLFICGFYKLSRHQIVVMPDGSHRAEGFLLHGWSEFWEQTNGIKSWQYSGEQLEEKFNVLKAANSKLAARMDLSPEKMSLISRETLSLEERAFIEEYLQVRVFVNADNIFLYLDEPKYLSPKWVRMMTSQCHVCMSSPFSFGGVMWAAFMYFGRGVFDWCGTPVSLSILMIIPFCISLAFLNYLIGKKADF